MSFALILQPHDVVLFRDGKPFSAGVDSRARSIFPPSPFTVQGAIRSRVLFSSAVDPADFATSSTDPAVAELRDLIGGPRGGYGKLLLRGPFLAKRRDGQWTRYFSAPADIAVAGGVSRFLRPLKDPIWQTNLPDDLVPPWIRGTEHGEEAQGWISEDDLVAYLKGSPPPKDRLLGEENFVLPEPRVGIVLDDEVGAAREGYLYLAEFLRVREDTAFWVEVEGVDPKMLGPAEGFLQLGGKSRVARYERVEARPLPRVFSHLPKRFKVILLSPAWFSEGWKSMHWSRFFSTPVKLVCAVIPRYQSLGGAYIDDENRRRAFHKPMYRFVPPGSVFFFERSEGDARALESLGPFSEAPGGNDLGRIGFGCAAIGEWDYA